MRYDFIAACCGPWMDFQDQMDLARWEDDGGAPARHYHLASETQGEPRNVRRRAIDCGEGTPFAFDA